LETFIEQWKIARADSAQAVEDMPAGKLDYAPQDDLMSFRNIAVHIIQAGLALTGVVLDGETDLTTPDFREKVKKYAMDLPDDAPAATIATALRESLDEQCGKLASRTPEFYAGILTKWDGAELTRMEMMQFVKEHELTHRSQLFLYLRMNGVTPVTTRRKQAQQKARA
ncbi:MAG: DinB family protein, partial [bacterium]|nr:DinB family protein [bacterium]